jgi:hypothetical protein
MTKPCRHLFELSNGGWGDMIFSTVRVLVNKRNFPGRKN